MSGKFALVIGNSEYTDPGLAHLTAPGQDAENLARVLKDPNLCGFDEVKVSLNQLWSSLIETIDEFFDQRKPDDLLVLYFSGHGIRDESGALYLACRNTMHSRLRSTAVKADYVREAMDQSRSKRQVLILDCCNSGAFPQGTKAEVGGAMGLMNAFQGYGRYVLTASDATQFAWEGDKVIGATENSLFTHFLVKGLQGEADRDGDGRISVDDLYDFAFEEIAKVTPNQTPTKSASKQAGEIVLRQITRLEDIRPVSLPEDLKDALEDPRSYVREGAVQQLEAYLRGRNLGLARSAREALETIAMQDDSYRVRQTAMRILPATPQEKQIAGEEGMARAEAESISSREAESAASLVEEVQVASRAQEKPLPAKPFARGSERRATLASWLAARSMLFKPPLVIPFGIGMIVLFVILALYALRGSALFSPIVSPRASTPTLGPVSAGIALPGGTSAANEATHTPPPTMVAAASTTPVPATATLATSTSAPQASAYTSDPPRPNGYIFPGEWKNAILVATLSHGSLYYLNDSDFLYLLVDVIGDTENDLSGHGTTTDDSLMVGFDVNNDKQLGANDRAFLFWTGPYGVNGLYTITGVDAGSCTAGNPYYHYDDGNFYSPSVMGLGFDSSPNSPSRHRFYELRVGLGEIGAAAGKSVLLAVSYTSAYPNIKDSVPPEAWQNCSMANAIAIEISGP